MKTKTNAKKVNVSDVSLKQLFEMFEGGEESNIEGLDEFEGEAEGEEPEGEEDFGDDDFGGEEEGAGEEGGETVTVEIDPNAPLADVLRTIADALDGGAAGEEDDFGGEEETEGEEPEGEEPAGDDDFGGEEEGGEEESDDDDYEDQDDEDNLWMPRDEDDETPATVTNGAPRKTVKTPEYQGKNKQTVNTNLHTMTGQGNGATVTNGAPRKTVNTPEYQGKNKQTVNSKLNPGAQMFQI